ncbi:DUF4421 domain-containing protein [Spirosoma aureum]|uniref:DUF4421 domain-containing protein n=1 Tax=Spirosoma aureum TaxID=2692134 RepID=A0A6G9APW1_9BACT|nr:DUF4421 family protein [Spirosoma aureum]QIP14521.1 DUF4421 domain-containing protein [Spirosoma aureum]
MLSCNLLIPKAGIKQRATFCQNWSVWTGLLLISLANPVTVYGQGLRLLGIPLDTLLKTKIPRVNPAYITTYYGRLHLYLISDRQDYALRLRGSDHFILYKPNLAWTLGMGFDYKWAGTELTIKLPFLGYNTAQKGKTKPFGISLNINNRRLWIAGQYQFYRGFYMANPHLLEPDWLANHSMYPYRNDLKSQTLTSHVQYLFNPLQISIPASLLQREGQRQAAGSWVIGSFLTYQRIHADSALVPLALLTDFQNTSSLQGVSSWALGVDGGYMQTVVLGKYYFINMSLRPGLSILVTQTKFTNQSPQTHLGLGWQGLASLTLGYSTDRYYGGIYASAAWLNRAFRNEFLRTDTDYIRLVAGKRLRYRPKGMIKKLPGMQ